MDELNGEAPQANVHTGPAAEGSGAAGDPQVAPYEVTAQGLSFSQALNALKVRLKVRRSGWNGKGMWIVLQNGYPDGIPINHNTAEATRIPEGTVRCFRPYLMMKTAQGDFVPWVASQTDILAEDWEMVPLREE